MQQLTYLDKRGHVRESFSRATEINANRSRWDQYYATPDSERRKDAAHENFYRREVLRPYGVGQRVAVRDGYEVLLQTCSQCGHEKIADKYHFRPRYDGNKGLRSECYECEARRDRSRKWRKRNLPNGARRGYASRDMRRVK